VTPEQCRAEALRRVSESDRILNQMGDFDDLAYRQVSHLRQTAAVFAAWHRHRCRCWMLRR
jgi:hypothetical protein